MTKTLADLNSSSRDDFVAALANVFEHSPWIAEQVAMKRPFAGVVALFAAMRDVVDRAPAELRLGLIRAHPDLANKTQRAAGLTAEIQCRAEQHRPRPVVGRRIRCIRARQQRLSLEIRLSLYRLRPPPHQGFDPARFRAPLAERRRDRNAEIDRGDLPDRGAAARPAGRGGRPSCRERPAVDPRAGHAQRQARRRNCGRTRRTVRSRPKPRGDADGDQLGWPHRSAPDRRPPGADRQIRTGLQRRPNILPNGRCRCPIRPSSTAFPCALP